MKKITKQLHYTMIIVFCFIFNSAFSQFGITPATGGAFGRTTNPIAGVDIGFFPSGVGTTFKANLVTL